MTAKHKPRKPAASKAVKAVTSEAPYEFPGEVRRKLRSDVQAPALLAALADALNACEKAGILVKLAHYAAITQYGYVLPVRDDDPGRGLGSRYAARTLLLTEFPVAESGDGED